jgi:hypothetical protein
MAITVKRYGGLLPMAPPSNTFELESLDATTRGALQELMQGGTAASTGTRMPDSYSYVFELADGAVANKVTVSEALVPEALRKLLP